MHSTHNWCVVSNRHMLFLSTYNLCVLSSSTCCWVVHRNEYSHYYSVYTDRALDSWHRQQSLLFSNRHILLRRTHTWCVLSSSMLMHSTHNWCVVSNRHMLFLSTYNLCVVSSSTCCWVVHRNEYSHYYSVYTDRALDSWHRQQSLLFSKTFHLWGPPSLPFKGYQE